MNQQSYGELLARFQPEVIINDAQHEKALAAYREITRKGEDKLTTDELRIAKLLVNLIGEYESKVYATLGKTATPLDVLKSIIEEHSLKQTELVDVFGEQSVLSKILSGKRSISKTQAKKLGERFNLSAEVFI